MFTKKVLNKGHLKLLRDLERWSVEVGGLSYGIDHSKSDGLSGEGYVDLAWREETSISGEMPTMKGRRQKIAPERGFHAALHIWNVLGSVKSTSYPTRPTIDLASAGTK